MITVQDRIIVAAENRIAVEKLLREDYLPGAASRGLEFVEMQVSPPVSTAYHPLTLWLRWRVSDVGAWWGMRAQSGTPEIAAFWETIDALCESRERTYLVESGSATLPGPVREAVAAVSSRGHRETAQLAVADNAVDSVETALRDAALALPGIEVSVLARNMAPEYAAGHLTWDLLFPDAATAETARQSAGWQENIQPVLDGQCSAVHAFTLETIGGGLVDAKLANGVKRTAYFRALPGQSPAIANVFEQDLLEMPLQIPEIINWRLSRAIPAAWNRSEVAPWTYVWEQEFASLEGLTGEYMIHPHHWAHIDRWFDPESGDQFIDSQLSHAFSPLPESLFARELVPCT